MSDFEKKILEFKNRLNSTHESKEIELIRTDIFSKNGLINSQFKKLGSLSEEEKKTCKTKLELPLEEIKEIKDEESFRKFLSFLYCSNNFVKSSIGFFSVSAT